MFRKKCKNIHIFGVYTLKTFSDVLGNCEKRGPLRKNMYITFYNFKCATVLNRRALHQIIHCDIKFVKNHESIVLQNN